MPTCRLPHAAPRGADREASAATASRRERETAAASGRAGASAKARASAARRAASAPAAASVRPGKSAAADAPTSRARSRAPGRARAGAAARAPSPQPAAAAASPPARKRKRRRRRFGRKSKGLRVQDLLLPPPGRQALVYGESRAACTSLLREIAGELAGASEGPDPIALLIDPSPEELADWKREAPEAEIVAAGQARHASDALAQAVRRAEGGEDSSSWSTR